MDPDVGDVLTYNLQSLTLMGTAMVNPDGTFTCELGNNGKNFKGDVTFDFRIIVGNGGTDIETVTVNPVNDGPVANDDAFQVAEGAALIAGVSYNGLMSLLSLSDT